MPLRRPHKLSIQIYIQRPRPILQQYNLFRPPRIPSRLLSLPNPIIRQRSKPIRHIQKALKTLINIQLNQLLRQGRRSASSVAPVVKLGLHSLHGVKGCVAGFGMGAAGAGAGEVETVLEVAVSL